MATKIELEINTDVLDNAAIIVRDKEERDPEQELREQEWDAVRLPYVPNNHDEAKEQEELQKWLDESICDDEKHSIFDKCFLCFRSCLHL